MRASTSPSMARRPTITDEFGRAAPVVARSPEVPPANNTGAGASAPALLFVWRIFGWFGTSPGASSHDDPRTEDAMAYELKILAWGCVLALVHILAASHTRTRQ